MLPKFFTLFYSFFDAKSAQFKANRYIYIYVCISGYLFVLKEKNRPYIFYYVYCTDKVDE